MPPTWHAAGAYCGVRSASGGWVKDGAALFRSQRPLTGNPSVGDMTLLPVAPTEGAGVGAGAGSTSVGASDDPAALWKAFAATGSFAGLEATGTPEEAAHGAASVTQTVGPNSTATLSIVFAWYFPDRDFSGEILGNMYASLWPSSLHVAQELGTEAKLTSVVADINKHHQVVAHPSNPTPVWLKDMLINQWSHFHMLMWSVAHTPAALRKHTQTRPLAHISTQHTCKSTTSSSPPA